MFERARLKLTAWYLAIIMAISFLFSLAIYANINQEFRRFEHMQVRVREGFMFHSVPVPPAITQEFIQHARFRLISTLGLINLLILGVAGGISYVLAGGTLRPIKDMVDEQRRFVTDASHELRTPLTSLRSEIEVGLRNKALNLHSAKKLLKSNLEEVQSLQALTDNLLELAQNGSSTPSSHKTNVILAESITSALKKLEGLIKKKEVTIEKHVEDVVVPGIEDRFIELFIILLDNAVKYSPKKSIITITAKKQKEKAVISVADQGIGIAKEDLPYIFDRFYRASKSRSKDTVPGYGLGLSIAKKIVESHNGTIDVTSTPGMGSTFTVHLPSK